MSLYTSSRVRLALVRPVPLSFGNALIKHHTDESLDVDVAQKQHEEYTRIVREAVGRVVEVLTDESCPDCCFIEDTAVVVGATVIITRMGAPSRSNESAGVLRSFQQLVSAGVRLRIHLLQEPAILDGGDVLQMGDIFFVCLSERSNESAIAQLRQILGKTVVSVPVQGAALHLKSVLSALDDRTLVVADDPEARAMGDHILAALPKGGRMVPVPDAVAANVVRLGTTLLVQEGFERSTAILAPICDELGLKMVPICMSELIKADGALTCCSILMP